MVFSWGTGGGEEDTPGYVQLSRLRRTTRVSEQSFLCYISNIAQWGFRYSMCQTIANGAPDPRYPGQARVMFKFRQPDDLLHVLKTVKVLLHFVPPRTPLSTCGLCYMLFLLYD
jgi:hypothetical protein